MARVLWELEAAKLFSSRDCLDRISLQIFCEGEEECTGEMLRGQFSIFGAVEEIVCHGCSRIFTDEEAAQVWCFRGCGVVVWIAP